MSTKLNFVSLPKNFRNDPVMKRREKMLSQLEQQRNLAQDPSYTIVQQRWVKDENGVKQPVERHKQIKRWWLRNGMGDCLLIIRYGSRVLELQKGKAAIDTGGEANLVAVIEEIMRMTKEGELDGLLMDVQRAYPKKKAA
ncbi:hypothetical protein KIH24_14265 [Rhizobiales bacterium TNE-4]|nr:hypothetical protein [Rhizobiales bacterium TNE-4]MBV1828784.1 hypothetical protein [Rhizobiales bacterium TNE-4]